jgi:hypothetical protein
MAKEFSQTGIEWTGRGYFGCPAPPPGAFNRPDLADDPWQYWAVALEQAKRGDFGLLPRLIDFREREVHPILNRLCTLLLGDAGTPPCFDRILRTIESGNNYEVTIDFANSVCTRGRLADVPPLVRAFESIAEIKDAAIIPVLISDVLEGDDRALSDADKFVSFNDYRDAVMARYNQVAETVGSDRALVFGGEQFGVARLAQKILDRIQKPYVRPMLRRRFEAATGIDCTAFYHEGTFQPLSASAILEEFLESPAAAAFEDGVRYFFGHPVPA